MMSANYWIKLYIEILDDPKMAILPDRLWRRIIELFLCAGRSGNGGALPETQQLAWLLRMNTDDLEMDLKQIAMTGIVQRTDDGWMVTQFAKRQAPAPAAERQRRHRDTEKKQQYYGDVTNLSQNVTQINRLTDNRLTDTETEKDIDKETEKISTIPVSPSRILFDASGLSAFPADKLDWIEVIQSLVEDHGVEKTTAAMKHACDRWKITKGKNGRFYSPTNLSWINWAQEELVGNSRNHPPGCTCDLCNLARERYKEWEVLS
jgi:hypothetical protein